MRKLANRIDGPVAVIGDLHGQAEKLAAIVEKLQTLPDYQQRWIVFIGDLVDRGPDSKRALELITHLRRDHPQTTMVMGNHDLAMSAAIGWIETPDYAQWANRWIDHYDAETTFASYGASFGNLEGLDNQIPDDHREYLAEAPWCVEHPDYLFVHAGLDLNTPFDMQMRILRKKDFTLTQPQWLCSKAFVQADIPPDCPLTVVSGHEFVQQVEFKTKRILIDTTGGFVGDLSCVLLPEMEVITSGSEVGAQPQGQAWWKIW